ncbi:MAG TPA: hypothetical protein VFA55_04515 [Candidatus Kapabacteria bacterium]|nr:hypothetical protein [Candidatus Kapabacteria bacterium]
MRSIKSNRGKPALIGLSITLATMAVVVISCTTTVDTNPVRFGGQQYAPPTAIRAIGGESSVIFVWKPSLDVDSSAFHGYYFSCLFTDTLGHVDTITQLDPNRIDTVFSFPGVVDGVKDSFFIQSVAQDGTRGPASTKIVCAAARQTTGVKLYGMAASDSVAKGLQLSINNVGAVFTATNPDSVDLVLDDRSGSFYIASANLKSSGSLIMPRQTQLDSSKTRYVSFLNDASLADSVPGTLTNLPLANASLGVGGNGVSGNGLGEIFFVKTQDSNYARIFVHAADSIGTLVSKDTTTGDPGYGYNYITLDVSFQTVPGLPYSTALRNVTPKKPE